MLSRARLVAMAQEKLRRRGITQYCKTWPRFFVSQAPSLIGVHWPAAKTISSTSYHSLRGALHRLFCAVSLVACLSLFGCDSSPESSFELASESRLPKWFALPSGLSRSDVTVRMRYYVTKSGRTSKFMLLDAKGNKLAEVNGTQKGLEPLKLKHSRPGFAPGYPSFEIITVNSTTEIIEHRKMEPIFYITDDPTVRDELENLKYSKSSG